MSFEETKREAERLRDPRRTARPARLVVPAETLGEIGLGDRTTEVVPGVRARGADVGRLRLLCGHPPCGGEFPIERGPAPLAKGEGPAIVANVERWRLESGVWYLGRARKQRRNRRRSASHAGLNVPADVVLRMLGLRVLTLPIYFACPVCGRTNALLSSS